MVTQLDYTTYFTSRVKLPNIPPLTESPTPSSMELFCFFMGVLYGYTFTLLLPLIGFALFFVTPRYQLILFFTLGLLCSSLHEWINAPANMPDTPVIQKAVIQGTIASLPLRNDNKTQFSFMIDSLDKQKVHALVQLAWYNHAPELRMGQRWQLGVKLKKPRNFLNPGSFDYVQSLKTRHIHWTGYIRATDNKCLKETPQAFDWLVLRERLALALQKQSPNEQTTGMLEALTLNITNHISQEQWELFRRTGTIHLFGISGEHIALVSGLVFFILKWLWSRSERCCLWIPAHFIASSGGLLSALLYAFLAGFQPPVQRALIGCLFYTLCSLGKQKYTAWQIWRYALFGVLCLEPHAVFMQGFYFSFLAVVCLLLTQQRFRLKGYKGNLALQLSCLIGLMPLTFYWFSYGSLNGFIANLFAIPVVGFVIVPLSLVILTVCSYTWCWILMKPLQWAVAFLFAGLGWIEHLEVININWALTSIEFAAAMMGALLIWVVLPIKSLRVIALIWLLLPLLPLRPLIKPGEALIEVLDVGQGLAVAIQTAHHTLLYDTGDQFFKGSDLGKMVILPYYQAMHIRQLDTIVISHPDKDHRGGLKSVEAGMHVNQLLVNNRRYYTHGLKCHDYPTWTWDGVVFRFLAIHQVFNDRNNSSCILKVSSAAGSVLFTGDIEKPAEEYLVKTYGDGLQADVLIVPHHASKTSSSYRFLLDIAPKYAIASIGFDNRFHFPHAKTLASMASLGIELLRTDDCGKLRVLLPTQGTVAKPQCFRQKQANYF